MKTVRVSGRKVAYQEAGEGPALLLLHGGWSDSTSWQPQLTNLADRYRVIAWDAPGCGGSDDPPASFSLADYADALRSFAHALGIQHAHVCGLSWGAGLAIELYHRHRDLPESLILSSAYAGWAGSLPPEEVQRRRRLVMEESSKPPEQWVDAYLPTMFSKDPPPEAIEHVRQMMLRTRPGGTVPMLNGFAEADLRPVLPTIDVPTLLLWGEHDTRADLNVANDLKQRIPHARLAVLDGLGHMTNLEAPRRFDNAVRRFVDEVESARLRQAASQ